MIQKCAWGCVNVWWIFYCAYFCLHQYMLLIFLLVCGDFQFGSIGCICTFWSSTCQVMHAYPGWPRFSNFCVTVTVVQTPGAYLLSLPLCNPCGRFRTMSVYLRNITGSILSLPRQLEKSASYHYNSVCFRNEFLSLYFWYCINPSQGT